MVRLLSRELEESRIHRDAIISDTRKWDSLTRTIQDICELHAKLQRDRDIVLEELAEKRRIVQLVLREKQAMKSELNAIDATVGTVGKYH
jgi:hypothetical protein